MRTCLIGPSSLPLSVQGEHAEECNHREIIHIEENPESFFPAVNQFHPPSTQVLRGQRGLNDLWKTRLSCGRLPPAPLSRQQVGSLSQSSCVSPEEVGRGRSRIIRPQESLALYKSFNTFLFGDFECMVYNRTSF